MRWKGSRRPRFNKRRNGVTTPTVSDQQARRWYDANQDGMTMEDLAREHNVSPQAVSRAIARIRKQVEAGEQ